jgi:hypothetical protein
MRPSRATSLLIAVGSVRSAWVSPGCAGLAHSITPGNARAISQIALVHTARSCPRESMTRTLSSFNKTQRKRPRVNVDTFEELCKLSGATAEGAEYAGRDLSNRCSSTCAGAILRGPAASWSRT